MRWDGGVLGGRLHIWYCTSDTGPSSSVQGSKVLKRKQKRNGKWVWGQKLYQWDLKIGEALTGLE